MSQPPNMDNRLGAVYSKLVNSSHALPSEHNVEYPPEVFRRAGFERSTIEALCRLVEREVHAGYRSSSTNHPADQRCRSANESLAWLAHYARFFLNVRRIALRRDMALCYPGSGLDVASILLTGTRTAVLVDPRYFEGLSETALRKYVAQWSARGTSFERLSPDVARASITLDSSQREVYFVGEENEYAENLVVPILGRQPVAYLAKGVEVPSVIFPPAWTRKLNCRIYAIEACGTQLRRAWPLLYGDVVFGEAFDDRDLVIARSYAADSRPSLPRESAA